MCILSMRIPNRDINLGILAPGFDFTVFTTCYSPSIDNTLVVVLYCTNLLEFCETSSPLLCCHAIIHPLIFFLIGRVH